MVREINENKTHKRNKDNNLIAFSWVGGDDGLSVVWKLLNKVDWPCRMYFVLIGDNPILKFKARIQELGYKMETLAVKHKYNELLHIVNISRL